MAVDSNNPSGSRNLGGHDCAEAKRTSSSNDDGGSGLDPKCVEDGACATLDSASQWSEASEIERLINLHHRVRGGHGVAGKRRLAEEMGANSFARRIGECRGLKQCGRRRAEQAWQSPHESNDSTT